MSYLLLCLMYCDLTVNGQFGMLFCIFIWCQVCLPFTSRNTDALSRPLASHTDAESTLYHLFQMHRALSKGYLWHPYQMPSISDAKVHLVCLYQTSKGMTMQRFLTRWNVNLLGHWWLIPAIGLIC